MSCSRVLLCLVLPPLAVLDKGCGTVAMVSALTLFGWVPGAIAALVLSQQPETVQVHVVRDYPADEAPTQPMPAFPPRTLAQKAARDRAWAVIGILFLVAMAGCMLLQQTG